MTRRTLFVTANFERNLDGLEAFSTNHPAGFARALEKLYREVLPLLRQQPNVGRLYDHGPLSPPLVARITGRLGGGVLRELVINEYLLLYLVGDKRIALLSLRHQRELDFDFGD